MRRPQRTPRIPLSPVARHERSRAALVDRVMALTVEGHGFATISRRPHMPRYATLERWRARDSAFRANHAAALRFAAQVMGDDVLALADRFAASATARQRNAAARKQFDARKWWLKTFADDFTKKEEREAEQGGLTEEGIAALQRALDDVEATARAKERLDGRAETPMDTDEPDEAGSFREDERTPPDNTAGHTAREESPPNAFVPRWLDDDRRQPERPYDPLTW